MFDFIISFDQTLFKLINSGLANPIFDIIMPVITAFKYWIPLLLLLAFFLLSEKVPNGRICALLLVLSIAFTDQMSSHLIKPLVSRDRPCKTLEDTHLIVKCPKGKSFPSSHAANSFGFMFILSRFIKKYKHIWFSIAGLIALSRVFVGVHYPVDIFCGALLGISCAWLIIKLYDLLSRKYSNRLKPI